MSKILKGLNEVNPHNYDSDWDYQDAVAKSGKSRSSYRSQEDDTSDADIAYSKKMYQLSQKQKRDADHDRLATGTNEEQLDELSNKKLGQYKTAAAADASKADSEGDYKRGDKRFSGIVKATKKQFANDTKTVKEDINVVYKKAKQLLTQLDENTQQRVINALQKKVDDEQPAEPFKTGYPRVKNPQILGTQNRAKSIYHPPSKPNVKKLDKPLPENLGNELKSKSLEALQQVKQQLEQQRMAELEQWEKDFKQNTVSKFTAREPNLRQRATSTSMVAMPGEKHSELKTRLGQLNKAIEKQGILDKLVEKLDKKGLLTPNIEAGVDTSMLARDGARDNYVELNKKLDKALEYVKNRLLTNKAAYAKPKAIDEEQLDELSCWSGYHRVAGTKAGFPGSCAKNKTNEESVAEGIPADNDMGSTTGGAKMTLGQWKQMWMKKMPNADFAAMFRSPPNMRGSAIAYFDGWMNNPDARWDPQQGVAEGQQPGEYSRVLRALNLYYPRLSMEELNTPGYHKVIASKANVPVEYAGKVINDFTKPYDDDEYDDDEQGVTEEQHSCPHCGGEMVSEELMNEKKDACYYKVKSRYKVWPSAYASGALVKCRKKGASNWGTGGKKNESSILEGIEQADESLHDWFNKEKWVRMDTKGNIKGPCAKEPGEGKPKCLPQSKAHSLGKKGRASAAQRKRREDPNPERSGKAINVNTKKK